MLWRPAGGRPTPAHARTSAQAWPAARYSSASWQHQPPRVRSAEPDPVRAAGQEIAALSNWTTFFSTVGVHFVSAYDTGHMSPSSMFAASWKPSVE